MNEPSLEERIQAQVSAATLLSEMRAAGMSDEAIAIGMGEYLGGVNPSAQSVRRWRMEKQAPSGVNGMALASLYKQIMSKIRTGT